MHDRYGTLAVRTTCRRLKEICFACVHMIIHSRVISASIRQCSQQGERRRAMHASWLSVFIDHLCTSVQFAAKSKLTESSKQPGSEKYLKLTFHGCFWLMVQQQQQQQFSSMAVLACIISSSSSYQQHGSSSVQYQQKMYKIM